MAFDAPDALGRLPVGERAVAATGEENPFLEEDAEGEGELQIAR